MPNWQTVNFIRGLFLDDDGAPSFARVFTAVIIAFTLGWVTRIVWATNTLPDLLGAAGFCTAVYGANKLATAMDRGDKA